MDLRPALTAEFERRRARNPRYSWRAFARDLETHHTTLRQIIDRRRRLTPRAIQQLGARIGLSDGVIIEASLDESVQALRRLVEAGTPRFVADARWIAMQLGLSIDDVQRVLQHALRGGDLRMDAGHRWRWTRAIGESENSKAGEIGV